MTDAVARVGKLEQVVSSVARVRERLVDPLEATALLESLGYTDAQVKRDFGLPDTLSLGTLVFEQLATRGAKAESSGAIARSHSHLPPEGFGSAYAYAIPFLCLYIAERMQPGTLQFTGSAEALGVALVLSLIVGGAFAEMISRCGRFYLGLKQPAVASALCGYLFRIGTTVTVALACAAAGARWYFETSSWPEIALLADEFIILAVLWMGCAMIDVGRAWWRVPLAFGAAGLVFVVARGVTGDAVTAQLIAAAVAFGVAIAQAPSVFVLPKGQQPIDVPVPRTTVVLYRLMPYFWLGLLSFCVLFADRFVAGGAVSVLGDATLLTFFLTAIGIDYAHRRFRRRLPDSLNEPFDGGRAEARAIGRYGQSIAIVFAVFVVSAAVIATVANTLWLGDPGVRSKSAAALAGYLLLAIGLLNVRVLGSLDLPWKGVQALIIALVLDVVVSIAAANTSSGALAAAGIVAGGAWLAVHSTMAVWAAFRRDQYAIAAG